LHGSVFGEEVDRGNFEGLCDGIQRRKRDVSLAALDRANVSTVEAAFFRANFLRPFSVEA